MELNSLGRRIQVLRESNMMTKTDLAQILGVTRKELTDWEEGRAVPTAEQIVELSRYFSVDPRSMVEEPGEAAAAREAAEAERKAVSGKKLIVAVFCLLLGIALLVAGVVLVYGMGAGMDAQEPAPAQSEEIVPLPECLALREVETALWDLDGDGEKELVTLEEDVLFVQGDTAYGLAESLPKGQTLTAQDGVFIVKNDQGESRIYSRLRDGALWPAG